MADNLELAQKLLPARVEKLYTAAHVARALLQRKASIAPNSAEGQAFAALDLAVREFNALVELAGREPTPVPEKIAVEKASMLG